MPQPNNPLSPTAPQVDCADPILLLKSLAANVWAMQQAGQGGAASGLPKQFSNTSDGAIQTASGSVTVAAGQKVFIQNLGMNPLPIRKGAAPDGTHFHIVLPAGTSNDDGTGGDIEIADYIGTIYIGGTSPRWTYQLSS